MGDIQKAELSGGHPPAALLSSGGKLKEAGKFSLNSFVGADREQRSLGYEVTAHVAGSKVTIHCVSLKNKCIGV